MHAQTDSSHRHALGKLTQNWGTDEAVSLYLERCQIDTPESLVENVWGHVSRYRDHFGAVVDFGAGDGRFALSGNYDKYIGYEVDASRTVAASARAKIINSCAFESDIHDADLAIGNPPFVRNQDLPEGWRKKAAKVLEDRAAVKLSGLANAWQYFFLLNLTSLKEDGLCALVIPYEWVSRPSAKGVRKFIKDKGWNVDVYRLMDEVFPSVLTTASITIVDKSKRNDTWRYFEEVATGEFRKLSSETKSDQGVLEYSSRRQRNGSPYVKRGLSPGTQKVLVLTEGERVANGLKPKRDVVRCVTSLKPIAQEKQCLSEECFKETFRDRGHKCWLINTKRKPSSALTAYLESVPEKAYQTKTCLEREIWWKFKMPDVPDALIAQTFKSEFPKALKNEVGAVPVGGVGGVYEANSDQVDALCAGLGNTDLSQRVVSYANGLKKIEINQLNWVLQQHFQDDEIDDGPTE